MKLKLKKEEITKLSSQEMKDVNGGGQGWSNFRTGNCKYSDSHQELECVLSQDEYGWYEHEVVVGCTK